jgi:hypothetical protein
MDPAQYIMRPTQQSLGVQLPSNVGGTQPVYYFVGQPPHGFPSAPGAYMPLPQSASTAGPGPYMPFAGGVSSAYPRDVLGPSHLPFTQQQPPPMPPMPPPPAFSTSQSHYQPHNDPYQAHSLTHAYHAGFSPSLRTTLMAMSHTELVAKVVQLADSCPVQFSQVFQLSVPPTPSAHGLLHGGEGLLGTPWSAPPTPSGRVEVGASANFNSIATPLRPSQATITSAGGSSLFESAAAVGGGSDAGGDQANVPPPAAPGDTEPGPRQLIVNYVPSDSTESELIQLFSVVGEVEACRVVYDKMTGASKGFGFVYYRRHADASQAITRFTGYGIRGKRLKVSYATPQRPVQAIFGDPAASATATEPPLIATNLPSTATGNCLAAPDTTDPTALPATSKVLLAPPFAPSSSAPNFQ